MYRAGLVVLCTLIALAAVSGAAAADGDEVVIPASNHTNNSDAAVSINVSPAAPVTNQPVTLTAENTSAINESSVFAAWDFDSDGIGDATGTTVTWTPTDAGPQTIAVFVTDYQNETTVNVTVTVQEGVAPVANAPPRDPDGDGRYEDVDGDGDTDTDDVLTYYRHRREGVVRDQPDAFDFDGDGVAGAVSDALALNEIVS